MYLFEKQKMYFCKAKADGYTYELVKQQLVQNVNSRCEYILNTVCDREVYEFKLSKRLTMRNSFNWTFFGKLSENEKSIVIERALKKFISEKGMDFLV